MTDTKPAPKKTGTPRRTKRTVKPGERAQVETAQRLREMEAVQLVLAGATWDQVAQKCGYSGRGSAFKAVHHLLDRAEDETAAALREVQGARLERLHMAIWPNALKGDMKAQQQCLRIYERQSRLFGLDMPVQVELVSQDELTSQIAKLAAELGDLAGDAPIPVE